MKIILILLFLSFVFLCMAESMPSKLNVGNGNIIFKPNKFVYGIVIFMYVIVSGLRGNFADTFTYKNIFTTIPSNIFEYLSSNIIAEDRGFYFIVAFIKQFISTDNQTIVFIFSLITLVIIFYGLYKYCDDIKLAVFLFVTMGCFTTSMNGIRQYVAASMLFMTIPLIEKRKFIPYAIIVYLVSTIHASAIIFLPIYFLNRTRGWGIISHLLILGGIFLYLSYDTTGPMIAELLGETQYGHYTDALLSSDQGANLIRGVIAFVPVVLSFLGKNRINNKLQYGNIFINLNILNFIFTLLANKYWIYARFCIYFNLFSIVLLCFSINNIFENRSAKVVKLLCVLCYFFYFYYDSLVNGLYYTSQYLPFL